jgi:hypothetical protein
MTAFDGRRHEERLDAHVNQPRERARRVVRVQRAEHQVTRQRRADGDLRGLLVADFTDHHHVRVLPQDVAQAHREGQPDLRGRTAIWLMPLNSYSTGSSIVMMRLWIELIVEESRTARWTCPSRSGR